MGTHEWYRSSEGVTGAFGVWLPLPFVFATISMEYGAPGFPILSGAVFCSLLMAVGIRFFSTHARISRIFFVLACLGTGMLGIPFLSGHPATTLLVLVGMVMVLFFLMDLPDGKTETTTHRFYLNRARWAASAALIAVLICGILPEVTSRIPYSLCLASLMIAVLHFLGWAVFAHRKLSILAGLVLLFFAILPFYRSSGPLYPWILLILLFVMLPHQITIRERANRWWDVFINHHARILISSFLLLCLGGTILLLLPGVLHEGTLPVVDAAFTAVSAVCVTGLVVLDTGSDFTGTGQFFILLLIQLGGLGIMSITTVALHALGKRLSMQQERVMMTLADSHHGDLFKSLSIILKVTIVAELTGALFLFLLFLHSGDEPAMAVWRGFFTAISAYCNAGFALQTDSLMAFRENPLILHTVGTLIILGGIAPATSILLPRLIRGQKTPFSARLPLVVTGILLASGLLLILALEWNGALRDLSIPDKIHNAWFQSATLRTAGFNTLPIGGLMDPTLMVMLVFMFIGGSPGGTAGGIKTSTVGVIWVLLMSHLKNTKVPVLWNRLIPNEVIDRAIAVVMTALAVWFFAVLALLVTQYLPTRDLIFEATSALGTVGLSTGRTSELDSVGKIIVIVTMFAGRIAPVTLFTAFRSEQVQDETRAPMARISL